MEIKRTIETGVLVIGGGGAGERAAYEASRMGAKVAMVIKGKLASSGCTTRAVSELSAFSASFAHTDPRDNAYLHFHDTVYQGHGMCNEKLVRILANDAPKRMMELVDAGCEFVREENGKFQQLLADASTVARACHFKADTGRQIANTLKRQIAETNVEVFEDVMITKLLTRGDAVVGAVGLDYTDGKLIIFKVAAVVLATGGGGRTYSLSAQPSDVTGDGLVLAARIGAKMVNMEFIQFGPALVYPVTGYLLVTAFWKLKPRIYNANGEEFLAKYLPEGLTPEEVIRSKEFAFPFIVDYPAMYLDIAMHGEITSGRGSEHGGIYLDVSHNDGEVIEKKVPVTFKWLLERGIDIRKQPIEMAPVAQCFIGGIAYDEQARTNIEGLYVCGEVSGGLHGAARPGGNLLCISQVFGSIAGKSAGRHALPVVSVEVEPAQIDQELQRLDGLISDDGKAPHDVLAKLQKIMWDNVSIVRDKQSLEEAINVIDGLRQEEWTQVRAVSPMQLRQAVELDFMLDVAKYVAVPSLLREESRGTFYRKDYPTMNNLDWLKIIELSQEEETVNSKYRLPVKLADFYLD